jgi:hypothetical protein
MKGSNDPEETPEMKSRETEGDILKRYLLGSLDPEAEEALENRLITGDRSFEELLSIAEDELIDEFVRHELDPDEHERFEGHFLCTPERRRRVGFASALEDYVEAATVAEAPAVRAPKPDWKERFAWLWDWSPTPALSYALVAALLVALIGGGWLWTERLRLVQELATLEASRVAESVSGAVATVWLAPGLLRGEGEVERILLPADATLVRIQLDLGIDDYASYRAALHDADGEEVWTQAKLAAAILDDKVAVTVTLPAEILPRGDYYIRLSGVSASSDLELVGRYYFRVLEE